MKRYALLFGVSLLIVSSVSSLAQTQGQKTVIRVSGSDSMFYRMKLMGNLFEITDTSVAIDISQGGTMDSGNRDVINGEADMAMSSCSINEEEENLAVSKGVKLVERLIGYGGIAIIANELAGVEQLTLNDVSKIFDGQITNWKQVGGNDTPIKVVRTDETHPGTLAFLQRDFMKAPFTANATVVSSFPRVVATVADSPGGVGYVRIREITESPMLVNNHRFKVISLRRSKAVLAVYPNRKTVADHSYPLLRPYFVYYSSAAKKAVVDFADFLVKKGWGPQDS